MDIAGADQSNRVTARICRLNVLLKNVRPDPIGDFHVVLRGAVYREWWSDAGGLCSKSICDFSTAANFRSMILKRNWGGFGLPKRSNPTEIRRINYLP